MTHQTRAETCVNLCEAIHLFEQALNDSTQQSIAFGVLKAVIKRKLTLEELPHVMLRVSHLAITSEARPVQAQCRQVVLKYMMNYPLAK